MLFKPKLNFNELKEANLDILGTHPYIFVGVFYH